VFAKKTYCFDIDGTICTTDCKYKDAEPFHEVIDYINKLYDVGNTIIIYTSRGSKSGTDWYDFTKNQIDNWGLKYHHLNFGKPQADYFIDDRAINIKDWCKINRILIYN
jgi:ribonucleotide monophosphatase NagD (HAD superfamily)